MYPRSPLKNHFKQFTTCYSIEMHDTLSFDPFARVNAAKVGAISLLPSRQCSRTTFFIAGYRGCSSAGFELIRLNDLGVYRAVWPKMEIQHLR